MDGGPAGNLKFRRFGSGRAEIDCSVRVLVVCMSALDAVEVDDLVIVGGGCCRIYMASRFENVHC